MKIYHYIAFTFVVLFCISCEKEASLDGTPENYSFVRNGSSTVSFEGQTTRIRMAEELVSALLNESFDVQTLTAMFRNISENGDDVDPFSDPELNGSSKSLWSKTAASRDYFFSNNVESAEIKNSFQSWIDAQVTEVFPAWNQIASPGSPGQIIDGAAVRYVNGQGLEYNQAFGKSLIGALMLDQMLNNYLSPSVLDDGDNRETNDIGQPEAGKNYTTMEHKWDEAYGYLFGNASNSAYPLQSLGSDDGFLNKYLKRVDNDPDFTGIAEALFESFKKGRYAITQGDYQLRDEQAENIKYKMSKIIAVRAVYYLQQAKRLLELNPNDKGPIFHDLSEAYGLIYSLRFTRVPFSTEPYFDYNEVKDMIDQLFSDGPDGFWDIKAETLDLLSDKIVERFDFELVQAAD